MISRLFFYLESGHGVGAHGAHGAHGAQLIFLGPMGPTGPSGSIVFTLPNGFLMMFLVPQNSTFDYHTGYGDPRRYLEILGGIYYTPGSDFLCREDYVCLPVFFYSRKINSPKKIFNFLPEKF